ncbi:uncharacterized mitochondrial protein AtMg00810-like [Hevea brasiliensis]|uniref:uncharacterized mitochondrial protein AtMg00810-like n=1 Tax=Hevea brasiliensis TaxID=3981 RepID=UPI0025F9D9D0|nr:uncharacterized mitochondrial protein AtMg00810-like [Hevea brasiliensis]
MNNVNSDLNGNSGTIDGNFGFADSAKMPILHNFSQGATDHITSSFSYFTGCKRIKPISVKLLMELNTLRKIGLAELKTSLYGLVDLASPSATATTVSFCNSSSTSHSASFNLWHYRLGHPFQIGNSMDEINIVMAFLDDSFRIKDLGELKYFLGIEIAISSKGILLNQRKYALKLLIDVGLLASKLAKSLMDCSLKLKQDSGDPIPNVSFYKRLIGRLLYLITTRPNLAFFMKQLSQYLAHPTTVHLQAAHQILKFIKGSPQKGFFFHATFDLQLKSFSDSTWKSKKHTIISHSSSEPEYQALAAVTCELQWLTYLLNDFCVPYKKLALVYYDN